MKNKVITFAQAKNMFQNGMTIMVGGFATVGTPEKLLDALIESQAQSMTVISNDSGFPEHGMSRLIHTKQIKKLIASHIGQNPETAVQMNAGQLEVELVPQGSLAEKIRAAGANLGGVLTQTGLGTEVQNGKEVIEIAGKKYLLEMPLSADIALIRGSVVDEKGNVYYKGTTQNFNPLMASAAEIVIVEAEEYVKAGDIQPETVMTPGVMVDYILMGDVCNDR